MTEGWGRPSVLNVWKNIKMKNIKDTDRFKHWQEVVEENKEEFEEGEETLCGNCSRIASQKCGDIHRCDRCADL